MTVQADQGRYFSQFPKGSFLGDGSHILYVGYFYMFQYSKCCQFYINLPKHVDGMNQEKREEMAVIEMASFSSKKLTK